jgi:iron complex outermembrane receptor protein
VSNTINTRPILLVGLVIAALLVGDAAYAAVEEIVVTARKREENLQDLPMSVTAFEAETMSRLGLRDLASITRYTPGVNLDTGFGLNDTRLVIRGLSPSRGRPNSAVLVDGIDLTSESVSTPGGSMLFNSRMLDIERVEIVKGPQSALYGRAAFAGAIQYVTRDPSEELETDIDLDVGDYGRRYINAGVSGGVTDTFGLRFNAMTWNEDGFYDEGFTGSDLGGGHGNGVSLTGKWDITDTFTARARVAYSEDDFDQQATLYNPVNTTLDPPKSSEPLLNIDPPGKDTIIQLFGGTPPDVDGRSPYLTANPKTGEAYPGGEMDVLNTSLTLNWEVLGGSITSYTGYADSDMWQIFDGDFDVRPNDTLTMDVARGGSEVNFQTDRRMISQELRYASDFNGPVQFTVGALYWDENVDQAENSLSALDFPFGPTGADPGYFNTVATLTNRSPNFVSRDTESHSVYGLIEWDITERWKVSFEGRYAGEKMEVIGSGCDRDQPGFKAFLCLNSTPELAFDIPGEGFVNLDRSYAWDEKTDYYFAPRAIVEWAPVDDLMTYASISKGVKPGGISTIASGSWMDQDDDGDFDELKFDAEELIAYEIGAKSTFFDNTLVVNGAVFFQDYDDKQIPVQQLIGDFAVTTIENAGEAEVWGVELETVWQPIDMVRLQLGYAWLDGEYTTLDYQTSSGNAIARAGNCIPTEYDPVRDGYLYCQINLNGNSMEDIPEHSLVALAGVYPPFGAKLNGVFEADAQYQSSRYMDEFNDRQLASFTLVNARIGIESEKWSALLYVNNVFDDDTIKSWSSGTGVVATSERIDDNVFAFMPDGFSIAPPPRHWGVRVGMRF